MFVLEGDTFLEKSLYLIRLLLPLPRFDLFLQGALLVLTLYDGFAYLLLRRAASAAFDSPALEDWTFMGAAGAELMLGALVGWWGRGRKQYSLGSWLMVAAVSGLLVLAFPQPEVERPFVELCAEAASPAGETREEFVFSLRIFLIITTAVSCSLARVSVWAHGVTYLDDHDPTNAAYFYGILISIRISVGVNARSWLEGVSLEDGWWRAQLSLAMLTLMFGILFCLFPDRIRGWPPQSENSDPKEDSEFFPTLKRLLVNKVLLVQTLALGLINAGVWGFILNERAYAQTRYHNEAAPDWSDGRTSRVVGDILRTFVIVFFVAVFRARFSGRRPEGVKATTASKVGGVVAILAAAFFTVIAVLRCDIDQIQSLDAQYAQPDCSQQCGCSSEQYGLAPVCMLDSLTTYFSPCHAGCTDYEDLNGFLVLHNCTCGDMGRAIRGDCNVMDCQITFAVYQIIYVNALALSAASILMQGMVILRSVRPTDKPTSIGFAFGLVAFTAHVLGHSLYMFIGDDTCAYNDGVACLLYSSRFPTALGGVSGALALLSALLSFVAFGLSRSAERDKRKITS